MRRCNKRSGRGRRRKVAQVNRITCLSSGLLFGSEAAQMRSELGGQLFCLLGVSMEGATLLHLEGGGGQGVGGFLSHFTCKPKPTRSLRVGLRERQLRLTAEARLLICCILDIEPDKLIGRRLS
jgi:hypothetical protein